MRVMFTCLNLMALGKVTWNDVERNTRMHHVKNG